MQCLNPFLVNWDASPWSRNNAAHPRGGRSDFRLAGYRLSVVMTYHPDPNFYEDGCYVSLTIWPSFCLLKTFNLQAICAFPTKLFSCDTNYSRLEHTTCDINYSSLEHLRVIDAWNALPGHMVEATSANNINQHVQGRLTTATSWGV